MSKTTGGRKVVDARADAKGNITAVKLEGNTNFTGKERAVEMAKRGELSNVHAVEPKKGDAYLRSNPDGQKANNLDDMAGDD